VPYLETYLWCDWADETGRARGQPIPHSISSSGQAHVPRGERSRLRLLDLRTRRVLRSAPGANVRLLRSSAYLVAATRLQQPTNRDLSTRHWPAIGPCSLHNRASARWPGPCGLASSSARWASLQPKLSPLLRDTSTGSPQLMHTAPVRSASLP